MEGAWPIRAVLACLAALAFAAPAQASTTIGMAATSEPNNCPPSMEFIQGKVADGGPSYDVPAGGGVITSWTTRGDASSGTGVRLKVYRPTAASDTWTVVAETPLKVLTPDVLNTFPARISVQAGDRIALRVSDESGGPCWFPNPATLGPEYEALGYSPTMGFDPPIGSSVTFVNADQPALVNIAAVVEPDADGDGFGDESQDKCVGVAGATNGCPPPAPPVVVPPPPEPQVPLAPAPQLYVTAAARHAQHVLKQHGIVVTLRPNVASTVTGTATVSIPNGSKVLRFKRATKKASAGGKVTLKLTLTKAQLRRVKAALRHHKLTAKTVLTTTATGQKPAVKRLRIRLKP